MKKSNVLILIPARFASSRFPGKPLAKILDKSMIQRVFENCRGIQSEYNFEVCVVTDDKRIEDEVNTFSGNVVRVDDDVISGTERIYLAYERYFKNDQYDLIINVQGDEPLMTGDELKRLVDYHLQTDFEITTLVRPMTDSKELLNPNRVKAIFSDNQLSKKVVKGFDPSEVGQTLYFSRAPIPHNRDEGDTAWFLHIGVYSYRPSALELFCKYENSFYENIEKLEQLRALELRMRIGAIITHREFIGVDTPDDLLQLEGVLRDQQ